ncbi:MAG: DUF507 family protein [Acidobacteriota bacterium]
MRLSRARVNHLSRLVLEGLQEDAGVALHREPNAVRLQIVRIFQEELRRDELIDRKVRQKIASQKRDIPEGGREWEILYRQYYQEEFDKTRPGRG